MIRFSLFICCIIAIFTSIIIVIIYGDPVPLIFTLFVTAGTIIYRKTP